MEVLKQPQYQPMPVEKQIIQIYVGTQKDENGVNWIRNVPVDQVGRYLKELVEFLDGRHGEIAKALTEKKQLDDGLRTQLDAALKEFRELFQAEGEKA
jgi:F-type H+-transporting ATPase subunit alpha